MRPRRPNTRVTADRVHPSDLAGPRRATARGVGLVAGVLAVAAVGAASTGGWGPYQISPGDSLWALAARHRTTVERIMTMNGLGDGGLRAGDILYLPGSRSGTAGRVEPPGGYVVQPGDSLSRLAARAGISVEELAARNGLNPTDVLPIGQLLLLAAGPATATAAGDASQPGTPVEGASAGSTTEEAAAATAPDGTTAGSSTAGSSAGQDAAVSADAAPGEAGDGDAAGAPGTAPGTTATAADGSDRSGEGASAAAATPVRTAVPSSSAQRVRQIQALIRTEAARQGVDPALALAVASVESDFDPAAVSHAGAVGVMQLMPRTAAWMATRLGHAVERTDPAQNIAGGVGFLRFLLAATSGDLRVSIGAYYQGLDSVQRDGFFPDTAEYVEKVTSRRAQFAQQGPIVN